MDFFFFDILRKGFKIFLEWAHTYECGTYSLVLLHFQVKTSIFLKKLCKLFVG